MPALGSDMDEGTLDEWLVKPGDKVSLPAERACPERSYIFEGGQDCEISAAERSPRGAT